MAALVAVPRWKWPRAAVVPDSHLARRHRVAVGERAATELDPLLGDAVRSHRAAVAVFVRHAVGYPPVQAAWAAQLR